MLVGTKVSHIIIEKKNPKQGFETKPKKKNGQKRVDPGTRRTRMGGCDEEIEMLKKEKQAASSWWSPGIFIKQLSQFQTSSP